MGQVSASSSVLIDATPEKVLAAVADYTTVRPKILSEHYRDYAVLEGGQGAGTVATWKLQATKSRVRDVKASVDVAGHAVIEKDANSSMVTNWTVAKTFAPLGLKKIQAQVLDNLKKAVESS